MCDQAITEQPPERRPAASLVVAFSKRSTVFTHAWATALGSTDAPAERARV